MMLNIHQLFKCVVPVIIGGGKDCPCGDALQAVEPVEEAEKQAPGILPEEDERDPRGYYH